MHIYQIQIRASRGKGLKFVFAFLCCHHRECRARVRLAPVVALDKALTLHCLEGCRWVSSRCGCLLQFPPPPLGCAQVKYKRFAFVFCCLESPGGRCFAITRVGASEEHILQARASAENSTSIDLEFSCSWVCRYLYRLCPNVVVYSFLLPQSLRKLSLQQIRQRTKKIQNHARFTAAYDPQRG